MLAIFYSKKVLTSTYIEVLVLACLTIQHNLWSLILSILELVSDLRDLRNSLKNLENSQKLLWSQLES